MLCSLKVASHHCCSNLGYINLCRRILIFHVYLGFYQAIIKDVTNKMGNGMANFARKAAFGDPSVNAFEEYDLYCWYVAGVVGEGLTHLFVEAGLSEATLIDHSHLNRWVSYCRRTTSFATSVKIMMTVVVPGLKRSVQARR